MYISIMISLFAKIFFIVSSVVVLFYNLVDEKTWGIISEFLLKLLSYIPGMDRFLVASRQLFNYIYDKIGEYALPEPPKPDNFYRPF
uniref:Uncharacterized protein n=1 Tax=viral metagenome TaxID=1070528 RepID=A0A6C0FAB0_9ZZZZ